MAKCQVCGVNTHWMCACGFEVCRAGQTSTSKWGKKAEGKRPAAEKCNGYYLHVTGQLDNP